MRTALERVRDVPGGARTLRRSFALVAGLSPGATLLFLLLVLLASALSVLQVWLAKLIVDALSSGDSDRLLLLTAAYVATLIVPPALDPVLAVLNAWFEDLGTREVDRRLMDAGGRMADLGRIERPEFRDELDLVQMSVFYLPNALQVVRFVGGGMLTLGGVLALLGGLHPLLPVALAAVALPHLLVETRYFQLAYEAMAVRSRSAREMEYYARLATEPGAAKEVRIFGLGPFLLGRFEDRFRAGLREVTRVRLSYLRAATLFAALHALALAGGFWYVAGRAGAGALSLGDLALYFGAVIQAEALLGVLPGQIEHPYSAMLHIRGLFRLVDGAGPSIAVAPPGVGRIAPERLRTGIELRRVSFRYPEGDRPVLEELDLALEAGKVTALVGANGAGKSTLVKLLTRMYDPDGGSILLDGVPLQAYDLQSLRSRIAVVYQDFARFSLTLRQNVAVGAAQSEGADPGGRVERAAQLSGADEVAERLKEGYDTQLTHRFEGGVELSGGEWQKVALARSFVRDAALVILDEPTSALDADAEYRLFAQFRELMQGRTALIISHRFSTVRMADRIIVVEDGRVLEEGAHEELIRLGGRYAELFEMQAGRYR